jgi:hypothetical protein
MAGRSGYEKRRPERRRPHDALRRDLVDSRYPSAALTLASFTLA